MEYNLKRYTSDTMSEDWDLAVSKSKNGTFQHIRRYMDYHADRFEDSSYIIYSGVKPVAVFPAVKDGNRLISHQGLTFGGLIYISDFKLFDVLECFNLIMKKIRKDRIESLIIKRVPRFYHSNFADEDEYAFFLLDAKLIRRDSALVVDKNTNLSFQKRRLRSIKKARKLDYYITVDDRLEPFWNNVLTPNLMERFGRKPVHSLLEINDLKRKFPENIIQHSIYYDGAIQAGATIFLTDNVVHAQYISATNFGRSSGLLDILFYTLIAENYPNHRYFDFGISNTQAGRKVNKGLLDWKEGFNGRCCSHDFYKINANASIDMDDLIL